MSLVINRTFRSKMETPIFQQKSKKLGQFFQIEKLLENTMREYLGRTGYFTPILHCLQWEKKIVDSVLHKVKNQRFPVLRK